MQKITEIKEILVIGPDSNNNRQWNISYTPSKPQNFLCEKCGLIFTMFQALNRKIRLQHTTVNLICPSCNYQTTQNDDIRRHLRTVHKLQNVGTLMENLQQVKKSEKPMMAQAPKKPVKKNIITIKPTCTNTSTKNNYIYHESLPKNKKPYIWSQDHLPPLSPPAKPKKFTTKPIKKLPVCNQKATPPPMTPAQGDPELHLPTDDLQDLYWLVHALDKPVTQSSPAPSSSLNTPMVSCTPNQEWITLDAIGELTFHHHNPSKLFVGGWGAHPPPSYGSF